MQASEAHPRPLPVAGGEKRAVAIGASLLLAACTPSTEHDLSGKQAIECLIPGQAGFELACTIEKTRSPDGTVLTVRAPDGEFRRLLIVKDGRGVIAADGAEEAKVKPAGRDSIDVLAGEIVWRLPAKVKG